MWEIGVLVVIILVVILLISSNQEDYKTKRDCVREVKRAGTKQQIKQSLQGKKEGTLLKNKAKWSDEDRKTVAKHERAIKEYRYLFHKYTPTKVCKGRVRNDKKYNRYIHLTKNYSRAKHFLNVLKG